MAKYKAKKRKLKLPRTIEEMPQTPHSRKSIHADKMRWALKAGKRLSASGNIYWETRQNRSDKKNKL